MEYLRVEVAHVGHDEDEDGLDDADLVRVPGDKARRKAPHYPDDGPAKTHNHERGQAG